MKNLIFIVLVIFSGLTQAEVIDINANNFADIREVYDNTVVNRDATLLVFDVDNTLLTTTQALGGVGWWDWQMDLLNKKPNSQELVANNFQDLLKIQNFLFIIVSMKPTDENVVSFLQQAFLENTAAMILTARGNDLSSTTVFQFEENGFVDSSNQLLFTKTKPKLVSAAINEDGTFNCPELSRKVGYNQGMVFLDGQNKGKALACILKFTKKKYDTVVFVDDSVSNINAVRKEFAEDKRYTVLNILYTHEHSKEQLFRDSPEMQSNADSEWKNITKSIHQNIKYFRLPLIN